MIPFIGIFLIIHGASCFDFWTAADTTLDLETMRAITPSMQRRMTYNVNELDPNFMPLCGNGVRNTKDDYRRYYATNAPLMLTRAMLMPDEHMSEAIGSTPVNMTLLIDEVCDDGNRLDFDGCSADCLTLDLWTTPCEIQLDKIKWPLEDLAFNGTHMIVSAADGIYRLVQRTSAEMSLELWGSKSFSVSDIKMLGPVLFLYSPQTHSVYTFGDSGPQLLIQLDLLDTSSAVFTSDGFLATYGTTGTIVLVDLPNRRVHLRCDSGLQLVDCMYLSVTSDLVHLQCGRVAIILTAASGCVKTFTNQGSSPSKNLWADLITATVSASKREIISYQAEYTLTDPSIVLNMFYMRFYSPLGMFGEVPLGSPRAFVTPGLDVLTLSTYVSYWKLFQFIADNTPCSFSFCPFDLNTGYDVLQQLPPTTSDWNDLIDTQVQHVASLYNLTTLQQIHSNASLYQELLGAFARKFKQKTANVAVKRFFQHPVSGHLWLVRNDSLFMLSKSGVRVELPNGRCLPSDIALCPPCYWAHSGSPCQPCTLSGNSSDWVWSVKCAECNTTGKRMLRQTDLSSIRFTIMSNIEAVRALWPNALEGPNGITVEIVTQDPVSVMRDVRVVLQAHPNLDVKVQPYQAIYSPLLPVLSTTTTPLPSVSSTTATPFPSDQSTSTCQTFDIYVVFIIVLCLIVLAMVVYIVRLTCFGPVYMPLSYVKVKP